jgi:hypothetical protein
LLLLKIKEDNHALGRITHRNPFNILRSKIASEAEIGLRGMFFKLSRRYLGKSN